MIKIPFESMMKFKHYVNFAELVQRGKSIRAQTWLLRNSEYGPNAALDFLQQCVGCACINMAGYQNNDCAGKISLGFGG